MPSILSCAALLIGAILGFCCARGARALGQQIAVTLFTVVTSVRDTITRHIGAFGASACFGILFVILSAALIIFTPQSAAGWAPVASKVIGFAANLTLGLAAGVGAHVSGILAKPGLCDSIDCELSMKRRTRGHLMKFLTVVAVCLGTLLANPRVAEAAPGVWVWAIDITDSVDSAQRKEAVTRLIQAAPERAQQLGASFIEVVKFDEAVMLSESTWVPVPAVPILPDCQKAKPVMSGVDGFILLSPGFIASKKQEAVSECLAQERNKTEAYASEVRHFRERLEAATKVTPRADVTTRIAPLVKWLVSRPETVAIDVATDGIDHSRVPLSSLRIPRQIDVTFIITRPNPKRSNPTLNEVLAAAASWGRVPGIKVTSAGDYLAALTVLAEGRP